VKVCEQCGEAHETRSKRFCSRKCMWNARPSKKTKPVEVTCPICKKARIVKLASGKPPSYQCSECRSNQQSGAGNPRWKGGCKQWSLGRRGKDKDGLAWKTQRKLAWERDNYECQHCHKKKNRKPDVHHISPWMNSLSHALDNLICLCQSCHLKEEAKVHEIWGGQVVYSAKVRVIKIRPSCASCGKKNKLDKASICWSCNRKQLLQKIMELKEKGLPLRAIAKELGLPNHQMVMGILKSK